MHRFTYLFLILFSQLTWSLEIQFGPEFTFGKLDGSKPDLQLVIGRMRRHLVNGQPRGAKFRYYPSKTGTARFQSPNGWSFTVTEDSGVIEVLMKPMTVEMYDQHKDDIQDAIFASAANVDHFPLKWHGGGHINFNYQIFKEDPLLFRNFVVDSFNHNELFMGIFGYDTHNALSWNIHQRKLEKFRDVIASFDQGNYQFQLSSFVDDLIDSLNRLTFVKDFDWDDRRLIKEHAINLEVTSEGRVEIRAVRPQVSAEMWVRQIRLIRNRLVYLKNLSRPLEIKPIVAMEKIDFVKHLLEPPVDPQEALRSFYVYLTESGEKWQDHTDYLWPKWIETGEVQKFERSLDCAGVLIAQL